MIVCHKTSVSSDAPTYFSVSGVPVRAVEVRTKGKQPRPLSSTRVSAESPFSFLERGIQNSNVQPISTRRVTSAQSHRYPKPSRMVTSELQVKHKITRNNKDSIDSLVRQIGYTKPKNSHLSYKDFRQSQEPNYHLYQSLAIPCSVYLTALSSRQSSRCRNRVTKTLPTVKQQIGEFENRLSFAISSQPHLSIQEKYDITKYDSLVKEE